MVMIGLRLTAGLDLAALERTTGVLRFDVVAKDRVKGFVDDGLVEADGDILRATPRGRLVLNALIGELIV